jgi:subtilase family serine protease
VFCAGQRRIEFNGSTRSITNGTGRGHNVRSQTLVFREIESLMKTRSKVGYLTFTAGLLGLASMAYAGPSGHPMPTIHEAINESKLVVLEGNTRPEATAENDRGVVPDSMRMDHMLLKLKRSPQQEADLEGFIDQLHDRTSPNYHKWLTPGQFAEHYGVAREDVDVVTRWLESKGFTVHGVQPTGLTIDFSGTAGTVKNAFHTEIHNLDVNGEKHMANMSDPKIPAALEPAVRGVVSLHDFMPKPQLVPKRPQYTYSTSNGPEYALVPGDIATIYNFNPAFAAGITGLGQTIMLLEDTYLYSTGDWTVFRKTFGLTRPYPHATLSQVSPSGAITCSNPGYAANGDDGEAAIDVEWASAAAPNAAIVLAACKDTTAFGGLIALENVLNGPSSGLPSVVSISYGEAETSNGATANAAYNTTYQQAVAEGVSIFVSSGDEGAASAGTRDGITVSGFTSSPYDVSVGGTDFYWLPNGESASTYWNSTNSNTYESALSYIDEIPWNDTCAGGVLANFLGLTPLNVCKDYPASDFSSGIGGSGGPSNCATGTPSVSGVASGTCAGWAKPSYQAGLFGNPSDGVRDIPDVSLFASNGWWATYYVVCWSNPSTSRTEGGGFTCTGAPSNWAGFGGTSVSSPIMAGIQALVNQMTGETWGNPNTVYYSLANTEYGASGDPTCNSTTVNKTSNSCVFYDITAGDNDVNCTANRNGTKYDCYLPSGYTTGVLSTSDSADDPAYLTNVGYDLATGIGSVNVWNLLQAWPSGPPL